MTPRDTSEDRDEDPYREGISQKAVEKWAEVAPLYGLPKNLLYRYRLKLDYRWSPPSCMLPPSMHKAMIKDGWRLMDVYEENLWLIPMLGLFEGRLIDLLDYNEPRTEFSSGGRVEHQIFGLRGYMFVVLRMKPGVGFGCEVTQLFLELLFRVHGLLTDLNRFVFYSFDPTTKTFYEGERHGGGGFRDTFCSSMIDLANKIFSILMHSYVEFLEANIAQPPTSHSDSELSDWKAGLDFAKQAHRGLQAVGADVSNTPEVLEEKSSEALKLLSRR
ncbi:hypothetical protein EST38_g10465 [Candolleomyces aberdarensis]|uniref:Uncharacterized protein n=1 Tax=Candolleomyces aberdarensis TaxID=2316362 RepID=A0A4Q2D7B2_9AGAR|nr:hypothetical protein EST38_g10465 [Candolleomyces aberdarensis]